IGAMCGRYASFLPAEAIARIFGAVNPSPNLAPSWNVASMVSAQLTAHSMLRRDGTEMVSTINEVDTTDEQSLKPFET
ncbi:MAG TPA: hypothetical protein VHT74_32620, partial [Acetobacteraceae bacterium]|nr:hypothetical protein [Acetobacteraceae bacterium]